MSRNEALSSPALAESQSSGLFQTIWERWQNRGDGGWGEQWTTGWKFLIVGVAFVGISMVRGGGDTDDQQDDVPSGAETGAGAEGEAVEGFTVDAFDVTVAAGDNIGELLRSRCEPGFAYQPSVDATKKGNGNTDVIRPTDLEQGIEPLELRCLYQEP